MNLTMLFGLKLNWINNVTQPEKILLLQKRAKKMVTTYVVTLRGCGGGTRTSRPLGYEPSKLPTAPLRDISTRNNGARDRT